MASTIVSQLSADTGISEEIVKTILDGLRDHIINNNSVGESVAVRGLFTAKAVPIVRLTPNGGKQTGFMTKLQISKTLFDATELVSLSKADMHEVEEHILDMDAAMREAGIAVMEIDGLN